VQLFEARWSDEQFAMHTAAGRAVDEILASAFRYVITMHRAGSAVSEYDVQKFIREAFGREHLFTDHGPIVAVNENMSDPHYEPTAGSSRPIRPGDGLLIDLWAKQNKPGAVYYDITWTAYCGSDPPSEMLNVFDVVRAARDAAIKCVQDGARSGRELRGFEVDDACRFQVLSRGFGDYFVHRTGHSIGEDVHGTGANMDNLETHDDRKVIPGTCFSIEPGVYLPKFGIRSEVNMFIKPQEAVVTGAIQRDLVRIT